MIRGAFQHFHGIGAERLRELENAGIRDWDQLALYADNLTLGDTGRARLRAEIEQCDRAITERNLRHLVHAFEGRDHWRILAHCFPSASYFDIETSGLDMDSHITVVSCLHRNSVYNFVHGENLEAFLDLLEEVDLLVSFNGASFDVPQVLRSFHIPELPCAHIDLRWICYHDKMPGGLKSIEKHLDINRPQDLQGVDGDEAVWLWQLWKNRGTKRARERLLRYCSADAVSLKLLSTRLLSLHDVSVDCPRPDELWSLLDRVETPDGGFQPAQPAPARIREELSLNAAKERMRRHGKKMRDSK